MSINWEVVANIAGPLIALFIGAWLNRIVERRPRLVSYYGHISAFRHTPPGGAPISIHTHSVILSNTGGKAATNVRLHHLTLPDFNIWPNIPHAVEVLPDGTKDIVIQVLVPKEHILISYLYFPPLVANQINSGIKCDQGFATQIPVLLQKQYPKWLSILMGGFMLIGTITVSYLLWLLLKSIL